MCVKSLLFYHVWNYQITGRRSSQKGISGIRMVNFTTSLTQPTILIYRFSNIGAIEIWQQIWLSFTLYHQKHMHFVNKLGKFRSKHLVVYFNWNLRTSATLNLLNSANSLGICSNLWLIKLFRYVVPMCTKRLQTDIVHRSKILRWTPFLKWLGSKREYL